ncbi:helix-turn-helix transcriptional regulator [Marinobacter sp. NFXS9]|uniref:XRE family transcriptional regulator n=1 Tax=Marinobacter sp. NFXS9 TaxID=2818433 RepID=UPI0032E03A8D
MSDENARDAQQTVDETGFTERLRSLIEGQSARAFAQKAGMGDSTFRNILNGALPRLDSLLRIANAADVSVEWLATGKEPSPAMPFDFEDEFALVPGYNIQVAAGHGRIADEESPSRELAFRRKWLRFRGLNENELALVFAKGDSMEPTISDNETVLIDTSVKDLSDGQIYVIRNDDHLLVKRIQKLWNDGVKLLSDNKEYPPQEISSADLEQLEVIGKVVWVGKDL